MLLYILLGAYFVFYACYTALHLTVGSLPRRKKHTRVNPETAKVPKWEVLLPAYRPTPVFLKVIKAIQQADFPGRLHIYVLFQEADAAIVDKVRGMGIYCEEVSFRHVKGNPYHEVLRHMVRSIRRREKAGQVAPSHVVLLDKDNVVRQDFFMRLLAEESRGDILQGRRVPLSVSTAGQAYDALAEALNDTMLRSSRQRLGYSPEFSGSGLAFRLDYFDYATAHLDARAPGMDKNLLIQLLLKSQPPKIVYVPDAEVSEEKTEALDNLQQQRVRWFGNQYFNAFYYGGKLLRTARLDAIDYAIALWRPPRSVQWVGVGLLAMVEVALMLLGYRFFPLFLLSLFLTLWGIGVFLLAEKGRMGWFVRILKHIPGIVWNNIRSLWTGVQKKSQGKFIHTEH